MATKPEIWKFDFSYEVEGSRASADALRQQVQIFIEQRAGEGIPCRSYCDSSKVTRGRRRNLRPAAPA